MMNKIKLFVAIFFIALAGKITAQTNYGITIAGVVVTSANCDSITGSKISGFVSYNHETKTLTLDNATIEGVIYFGDGAERIEDITITLVGENTVTSDLGLIETVMNTKRINGDGSLKAKYIVCSSEQNTIIENCTIDIDAATKELDLALYGVSSKLTIKNANLSSEAMEVAIGGFADIELIGCEIVEPVNAQIIDKEFKGLAGKFICNEDSTIAKKVVIKKSTTSYGIGIAGIEVTSDNCNNITGAKISGSVSYNHETKTLTLDNATIGGDIGFALNKVNDITITLEGDNNVNGRIESVTGGTKKINGTGSLKVEFIAGFLEKNTIIEDCTIDIDAATNDWDWAMFGADNTKLTIKNANLSAVAKTVAIGDFAEMELIGCEIVEPVNAQTIDTEFEGEKGKYICNEDGTIATKVVIRKLSGLDDIAQTNSINVYPNPATHEIVISNLANNELVEIFDITGKLVKQVIYNNKVDVSDLLTGVYTIKVNNQIQKLVIE